jgi:hypothetical protein
VEGADRRRWSAYRRILAPAATQGGDRVVRGQRRRLSAALVLIPPALEALRRSLVIAQDSRIRVAESALAQTLSRLEAAHGDPVAALDHPGRVGGVL